MLANAIANAYLAESKKSQATAARRATNDLSGRLKELQERLRNAENTLAVYKAQNNFVGTQDTLISDQQLSASNQRLAAARALTLDAQAKYDQIEASRTRLDRRRRHPRGAAVADHRQSACAICRSHASVRPNCRANWGRCIRRCARWRSRSRICAAPSTRKSIASPQSAKNDLTRARDYEASLNKALEAQKRQSVQMSQASVRLRELERDVEASRDVYQSFLKRSRETEEQESLNTSSARIIGEATVPQRRTFPPAMSLLAMIGFVLGALAAAAWIVAADQLVPDANPLQPSRSRSRRRQRDRPPPPRSSRRIPNARPQPAVSLIEKPLIARLQESDVMRTLGGILATGGTADVTRLGWPTLRAGFPLTTFLNAMREMRDGAGQTRTPAGRRARHGRDRRRRRPGPQHRRAEHRARGRARRRQGADDRRRSQRPRAVGQGEPPRQERAQPSRLAQHRRQGFARDQDRERNFDPAGHHGLRRQSCDKAATPSARRSRRRVPPAATIS